MTDDRLSNENQWHHQVFIQVVSISGHALDHYISVKMSSVGASACSNGKLLTFTYSKQE